MKIDSNPEEPVYTLYGIVSDGLHPLGKGRFTWSYRKLLTLKVGEAIAIPFDDWKTKDPPYRTIRTAAKNLKREFDHGRHPDGSWVVGETGVVETLHVTSLYQ